MKALQNAAIIAGSYIFLCAGLAVAGPLTGRYWLSGLGGGLFLAGYFACWWSTRVHDSRVRYHLD